MLAAGGELPGGWPELRYHRLHGSPRTYYSTYDHIDLQQLAENLQHDDVATRRWCIFDNTASGAASTNALELDAILSEHGMRP